MEEKRNNTGLAVLITILVIAVLGLTGFIVYDKVLNNEKVESNAVGNGGIDEKYDNGVEEGNTNAAKNIEKIKKNVSKVISFDKLNEDFNYLKLTKNGDLLIGINANSSMYKKYSKEYLIANEVLDVYIFSIGNGGYQYIYALKNDGTIDRMEITYPASHSNFKWEENYKNLKNIIYLDIYSDESPRLYDEADGTFEVYDQTIAAVDIDGNTYNLGQATDNIYVKKQ